MIERTITRSVSLPASIANGYPPLALVREDPETLVKRGGIFEKKK